MIGENWNNAVDAGNVNIPSKRIDIVPGKSDLEKANEFRERTMAPLNDLIGLINEARRDGLIIQFQIGPPDAFNRQSLTLLEITKKLC